MATDQHQLAAWSTHHRTACPAHAVSILDQQYRLRYTVPLARSDGHDPHLRRYHWLMRVGRLFELLLLTFASRARLRDC